MSTKVVIISLIALALRKKYPLIRHRTCKSVRVRHRMRGYLIFNSVSLELHLRCLFASFGGFKVGTLLKAEKTGKNVFGEAADCRIKILRRIVEVGTCHVDAVFRTFQLGLELQEVLVGFQVGIVFGNGEQLAESGSNRALCLLVFGQLFRCQVVGVWVALLRASTTPSSVSFS